MKKTFVFTIVLALCVFAGAADDQQYKGDSPPGSKAGPIWFNVQTTDLRLTVADTGIYGGFYQSNDHGLFFHVSTPRPPDHRGTSGYALHSNPTNDQGHYGNGWDHWAAMPSGVTLPSSGSASVSFWAHWSLEEDNDGVRLEIAKSDDGYASWVCLQPSGTEPASSFPAQVGLGGYYYDGSVGGYGQWNTEYTCAIPAAYMGKTIKFRFRIVSDNSDVSTGFLVDDFTIIANGSTLVTYSFNDPDSPSMWVTDNYWGVSAQSLWTNLCLFQGEMIAGVSSTYVVDYFDFDWQAFGADYGPPLHLRQTNRWTAPAGQPKFDMESYFYAPSGSGAGKYIIVDCYLKRVNDEPMTNLFLACNMEPTVVLPYEVHSQYNTTEKMIWLNYDGNLTGDCMGIIYLAPGGANPYAARIRTTASWGNDSYLYSLMSTQQYDTGTVVAKPWTLISRSVPCDLGSFPVCGYQRFTFAFVCGDTSTELFNNATSCRQWYNANLASNPQTPTKVTPASLGNIKALYK